MKRIHTSIGMIIILALITSLISCKHDPGAEEVFLGKISSGPWAPGIISVDGVVLQGAFSGFTLSFTKDKHYTTTNGNAPIWPASGTFTLTSSTATPGFNILRADGVAVQILELTDHKLVLTLHYVSPGGRMSSVTGDYRFELTK
jgi:hypothetical protein